MIIMVEKAKISADDLPEFNSNEEPPSSSFRFPSFKDATDAYQREFILHKLSEADGNVSKAAELMGIDRSHLYRRMKIWEFRQSKFHLKIYLALHKKSNTLNCEGNYQLLTVNYRLFISFY